HRALDRCRSPERQLRVRQLRGRVRLSWADRAAWWVPQPIRAGWRAGLDVRRRIEPAHGQRAASRIRLRLRRFRAPRRYPLVYGEPGILAAACGARDGAGSGYRISVIDLVTRRPFTVKA